MSREREISPQKCKNTGAKDALGQCVPEDGDSVMGFPFLCLLFTPPLARCG
jgi:hypothetical protein